jgi:AcrR family transcriptional regulator
MAKSGAVSTVNERGGRRSAETRRRLVEAATETLKTDGFVGASARAIAERAGSNQGLIFYHFGSVANLLLAALDAVSVERFAHYERAVSGAGSLPDLVEAAADIFRTDLDAGYITVLVELIAGASSSKELGSEVAARMEPWRAFAERAIERAVGHSFDAVLPASEAAYAFVALYLGLEMLSHLDGDRRPALELFTRAQRLAELLAGMTRPEQREVTS